MKRHYFEHDYSARNDQKILQLRFEHGAEGYGVFWFLIETMAEDTTGYISMGALGGVSIGYGVGLPRLEEIVETCLKVGLFQQCQHGKLFNQRILDHKKLMDDFSKHGQNGGKKSQALRRALREGSTGASTKESKGEESKGEDNNTIPNMSIVVDGEKVSPKKKFTPPTFEEFEAFCKDKGYSGIARRAFDGYSLADWHDAKGAKILNWKSKLNNGWFREDNRDKTTSATQIHGDIFSIKDYYPDEAHN